MSGTPCWSRFGFKREQVQLLSRETSMTQAFGLQLSLIRATHGLRTKHLAQLVGVTAAYLTQIEKGRREPPRRELLGRICSALQLTPEEAQLLMRTAARERTLKEIESVDCKSAATKLAAEIVGTDNGLRPEEFYHDLRDVVHKFLKAHGTPQYESEETDCSSEHDVALLRRTPM